jgi:hypothetical protein
MHYLSIEFMQTPGFLEKWVNAGKVADQLVLMDKVDIQY